MKEEVPVGIIAVRIVQVITSKFIFQVKKEMLLCQKNRRLI